MSEVLLRAEDIGKKFSRTIKHTMLYGVEDLARSFFGLGLKNGLRAGEFWAVDGVSFEVRRGETLGLIGPNGSGKSTVLKMLNGIFMPDRGRIEIQGKVGALIEVGAGFHPVLTGKENIYINGSILGMTRCEIDEKFDSIVNFAEIEDFIDAPVKHYSSGMKVRLGFAVAIHCAPDILLIDEVLAVGDVGFRAKCLNAIGELSKNAAVLLVSHQMPQVARVCSDICVLTQGKIAYQGADVPKGIECYFSNFDSAKTVVAGSGKASIQDIEFESKGRSGVEKVNYLDDLTVRISARVDADVRNPVFNLSFLNRDLQIVAQCNSLYNCRSITNTGDPVEVSVRLASVVFNPGFYTVSAFITDERQAEILAQHYAAKDLKVSGSFVGLAPVQLEGEWEFKGKNKIKDCG